MAEYPSECFQVALRPGMECWGARFRVGPPRPASPPAASSVPPWLSPSAMGQVGAHRGGAGNGESLSFSIDSRHNAIESFYDIQ